VGQILCLYCHIYVDEAVYAEHEANHLKLRPDGQQTDYVTLPTDAREQGSLEDIPKVYIHQRCQAGTRMPEEIIRSYLKNPYLYLADRTFCTGCKRPVRYSQCVWSETGENLQSYFDRLRAEKLAMRPGILTQAIYRLTKWLP
jgi:hypothetical protein